MLHCLQLVLFLYADASLSAPQTLSHQPCVRYVYFTHSVSSFLCIHSVTVCRFSDADISC